MRGGALARTLLGFGGLEFRICGAGRRGAGFELGEGAGSVGRDFEGLGELAVEVLGLGVVRDLQVEELAELEGAEPGLAHRLLPTAGGV